MKHSIQNIVENFQQDMKCRAFVLLVMGMFLPTLVNFTPLGAILLTLTNYTIQLLIITYCGLKIAGNVNLAYTKFFTKNIKTIISISAILLGIAIKAFIYAETSFSNILAIVFSIAVLLCGTCVYVDEHKEPAQ